MSWLDAALKHLWKAARGGEHLAVFTFTYVTVDKLPGVASWRIKWRYHETGPWVGFMPFTGTREAALDKAMTFNSKIRKQLEEAKRKNQPTGLKHLPVPRYQCPACQGGDKFHTT